MADKTVGARDIAPPPLHDVHTAPFIFFDGCSNFANRSGIVELTLFARRQIALPDGGVETDLIVVAHLRSSVEGAIYLRNVINDALLLGAPVEGQSN